MSLAPYFGGGSMGFVAPLPQTTFRSLAGEVFDHPILLPYTRQSFHALPQEERDKAKRVRYVIPAAMTGPQRRYENAAHCNLVFLDIDPIYEDKKKTVLKDVPARAVLADALFLQNTLAPFSFVVYHTASSTPEVPRLRVVVAADAIPVEEYPAAASLVATMLGLPSVTSESLVAVQPMFLPVSFRNAGEDEHPVVASYLEGRALTREDIAGTPVAPKSARSDSDIVGGFDLDHLRPRVEEVTEDDIRAALDHLDADCDRKAWVGHGAALKHQFGDAGLALWQEWSRKGEKYPGDEELETQWRSLRATPRGRAPITVRSILKAASEKGWDNSPIQRKCFEATSKWICEPMRTVNQLLREAVARIVATPLLSVMETGALLSQVQDSLKEKGHKVSRADLQKQLRQAEAATRGRGGDDTTIPDDQLPAWARGITYIVQANEFYRHTTGQKWKPEALNNAMGKYLLTQGEEESMRPTIRPQDYLLNKVKIPCVDFYLYNPERPADIIVNHDRRTFINTYRPTYPEADLRRAKDAGAVLEEHLRRLIGDTFIERTLLDWCAYQIQTPGAKILWCPVIYGPEGAGKTALAEALMACLGPSNSKKVSAHAVIDSKWTEWAADTQLVVVSEIRVVGESRHAVMNKLKELITDETIPVEQRNQDTRTVKNYANYYLTSNHDDALAITANDRRYFVIATKARTEADVIETFPEPLYFDRLFDMIRDDSAGLRAYFLSRDISEQFKPKGRAPSTAAKRSMVETSAPPLHRAVGTCLEDGDNPLVKKDLVSTRALRELLTAEHPGAGRFTDALLATVLRESGYLPVPNGRVRLGENGERHTLWSPARAMMTVETATRVASARIIGEDDFL
jgi:hypothetical protein